MCRKTGDCCSDFNFCEAIENFHSLESNIENCKYSTKDKSTCLQCKDNFYLYNNNCLKECPSKSIVYNTNRICIKKTECQDINCIKCSSRKKCQKCMNGMFLHEDKCLKACPIGFRADKIHFTCHKKDEYSFYWVFPSKYGCNGKCGLEDLQLDCSCKHSCLRRGDCCDDFESECVEEFYHEGCKLCKYCFQGKCHECKKNSSKLDDKSNECECDVGYEYDQEEDICIKKKKKKQAKENILIDKNEIQMDTSSVKENKKNKLVDEVKKLNQKATNSNKKVKTIIKKEYPTTSKNINYGIIQNVEYNPKILEVKKLANNIKKTNNNSIESQFSKINDENINKELNSIKKLVEKKSEEIKSTDEKIKNSKTISIDNLNPKNHSENLNFSLDKVNISNDYGNSDNSDNFGNSNIIHSKEKTNIPNIHLLKNNSNILSNTDISFDPNNSNKSDLNYSNVSVGNQKCDDSSNKNYSDDSKIENNMNISQNIDSMLNFNNLITSDNLTLSHSENTINYKVSINYSTPTDSINSDFSISSNNSSLNYNLPKFGKSDNISNLSQLYNLMNSTYSNSSKNSNISSIIENCLSPANDKNNSFSTKGNSIKIQDSTNSTQQIILISPPQDDNTDNYNAKNISKTKYDDRSNYKDHSPANSGNKHYYNSTIHPTKENTNNQLLKNYFNKINETIYEKSLFYNQSNINKTQSFVNSAPYNLEKEIENKGVKYINLNSMEENPENKTFINNSLIPFYNNETYAFTKKFKSEKIDDKTIFNSIQNTSYFNLSNASETLTIFSNKTLNEQNILNDSVIKTNSKINNSINLNDSVPINNPELIRNSTLFDSRTLLKPDPYLNKTINEKYIKPLPSSISHIPNNLTYFIAQKNKENSTSDFIEFKEKPEYKRILERDLLPLNSTKEISCDTKTYLNKKNKNTKVDMNETSTKNSKTKFPMSGDKHDIKKSKIDKFVDYIIKSSINPNFISSLDKDSDISLNILNQGQFRNKVPNTTYVEQRIENYRNPKIANKESKIGKISPKNISNNKDRESYFNISESGGLNFTSNNTFTNSTNMGMIIKKISEMYHENNTTSNQTASTKKSHLEEKMLEFIANYVIKNANKKENFYPNQENSVNYISNHIPVENNYYYIDNRDKYKNREPRKLNSTILNLLKLITTNDTALNPQNKNSTTNIYIQGDISINLLIGNKNPKIMTTNVFNNHSFNTFSSKEKEKLNNTTDDGVEDTFSFLSINSTYHVLNVYLKNFTASQNSNNLTAGESYIPNSTQSISLLVKNLR